MFDFQKLYTVHSVKVIIVAIFDFIMYIKIVQMIAYFACFWLKPAKSFVILKHNFPNSKVGYHDNQLSFIWTRLFINARQNNKTRQNFFQHQILLNDLDKNCRREYFTEIDFNFKMDSTYNDLYLHKLASSFCVGDSISICDFERNRKILCSSPDI